MTSRMMVSTRKVAYPAASISTKPFQSKDPITQLPSGPWQQFAYQVSDADVDVVVKRDNGWMLTLRETSARQQLKALLFQDPRKISTLTFQRFAADGKPINRERFVLRDSEITDLAAFLAAALSSNVAALAGEEGLRLNTAVLAQLLEDESTRRDIYGQYKEALAELFAADVSSPEVVAIARRRQQLAEFEQLLNDEAHFARQQDTLKSLGHRCGPEEVWQHFFDQNRWIFGTGLAPQFLHAWDEARLEQTVVGSSVNEAGKRPDALMRTADRLSALVFVELKHHRSPLLRSTPYRPGAWQISAEVAGGVAQCQATVDGAVERFRGELRLIDADGAETGDWAIVCRPRSLLVTGSLDEFRDAGRLHKRKFESFERFRRSLRDPEIITP